MARSRFVLRYQGEGPVPAADVAQVTGLSDAVVVDASPRMLLVDCEPEPLEALVDALPNWVMAPEQRYQVPDTRRRPERPPVPLAAGAAPGGAPPTG